jgi:hypothetical protein
MDIFAVSDMPKGSQSLNFLRELVRAVLTGGPDLGYGIQICRCIRIPKHVTATAKKLKARKAGYRSLTFFYMMFYAPYMRSVKLS